MSNLTVVFDEGGKVFANAKIKAGQIIKAKLQIEKAVMQQYIEAKIKALPLSVDEAFQIERTINRKVMEIINDAIDVNCTRENMGSWVTIEFENFKA